MFRKTTTDPVANFVLSQINNNPDIKKYILDYKSKKDLIRRLKRQFKHHIDGYLFRHANWNLIALEVFKEA